VQIAICIGRRIIVDHNIYTFNVYAAAKDISGHEDSLLEIFELLITRNSVIAMNYLSGQ
jgi:hypothetical protein